MVGQRGGGVARPQSDRPVLGARVGRQQLPGIEMGRLQHEDMDLAGGRHRLGHVEEAAGRQEGEPEQDQPGREVQQLFAGVEAPEDHRQVLGRAGLVDPLSDPAPQPGLPDGVVVQGPPGAVDQPVLGPLPHHMGAVQVVTVEQVGDATALGVEGGPLPLALQHRQPGGERGCVGLHDGLQDGPHHPLDAPRISLVRGPVDGQDGTPEIARVGPNDVGGDTVAGAGTRGSEMAGQLEAQPPPHPVRRDRHPLRRERVRERGLEHPGQGGREGTGRAGRVQMHHRPATLVRGCDMPGRAPAPRTHRRRWYDPNPRPPGGLTNLDHQGLLRDVVIALSAVVPER